MTPTFWLLLGLAAFILLIMVLSSLINIEWKRADEPIYRTADGGVLSADARAALRQANVLTPAHSATCCCNLTTARREGTAAALHDMSQKPGTPPTANPYAHDALTHVAWRRAYQRTHTATEQRGAA